MMYLNSTVPATTHVSDCILCCLHRALSYITEDNVEMFCYAGIPD